MEWIDCGREYRIQHFHSSVKRARNSKKRHERKEVIMAWHVAFNALMQ